MKSFSEFLTEAETSAAQQAKQMGLTSAGFGNWKNASGQVTHVTKNGQLQPVATDPGAAPQQGQPDAAPTPVLADTAPDVDPDDPRVDEVAKQLSGGKWAVADSKFKAQRRDMAMRQIQAYNDQEFASQQEMEAQAAAQNVPAEEPDPMEAKLQEKEMNNKNKELDLQAKELKLREKELNAALSDGNTPLSKTASKKKATAKKKPAKKK